MKKIAIVVLTMILGMVFSVTASAQYVNETQTIDATGSAANNSTGIRHSNEVVYDQGYLMLGGRVLSAQDMAALFPAYIYNSAIGGQRMRRTGKGLIIGGSVTTGVGILALTIGAISIANTAIRNDGEYYGTDVLGILATTSGALMTTTGVCLLGAGIPLYIVGQNRMRRAANAYNSNYANSQYSLNLAPTGNGVGLVFRF